MKKLGRVPRTSTDAWEDRTGQRRVYETKKLIAVDNVRPVYAIVTRDNAGKVRDSLARRKQRARVARKVVSGRLSVRDGQSILERLGLI